MKLTYIIGLILCFVSLGFVGLCIFTDWNDSLFLILALSLSLMVNLWNVLRFRGRKSREDGKK